MHPSTSTLTFCSAGHRVRVGVEWFDGEAVVVLDHGDPSCAADATLVDLTPSAARSLAAALIAAADEVDKA
ncbi:MAG: hypothetical protein INR66_12715 [Gordonia polyisoprenivorans]|nr:hypothetical protein [Gordonia polyisoprenivorans]